MATALLALQEPELESTFRVGDPPPWQVDDLPQRPAAGARRGPRRTPRQTLLALDVVQRAGQRWTATVSVPVGDLTAYVRRLTGKLELLLDEVLALLAEVRPLVPALVHAVERGLLDEVTDLVREVRPLVPALAEALDRGLLDDVDATLARLETLPGTQDDVRLIVETLNTLVGLTTITLDQLESIPGAGLVRRRINRALADAVVSGQRVAPEE